MTQDVFGPFPVMCSTGSCEYNSTAPPPIPPYIPPPPYGYWSVVAIFAIPVVGIVAAAAACAAVRERRNRVWDARRAQRGDGEDAAPLLGVASAGRSDKRSAPRPRALSSSASLSFEDITFSVGAGDRARVVLRGVSGHARAGTLAILGPSGAGALPTVACERSFDAAPRCVSQGRRRCWIYWQDGRVNRMEAGCS